MALQTQVASIDFIGGADTKRRDKLVLPGKLVSLFNGVFDQGGTISKRPGTAVLCDGSLLGGGAISGADMVKAFGDELLQAARDSLYSLSSVKAQLVARGRSPFVSLRKRQVTRNTATQTNPDHCYAGGFVVTAWEDSRGGIRYSVRDHATGTFLIADAQVSATGVMPRVVRTEDYFVIVYIEGANLRASHVTIADPQTALTNATLQTNVHATQKVFDAVRTVEDNEVWVSYATTAPAVDRFMFNPGGAVTASVTTGVAGNVGAIAISMTSNQRFQTWYSEAGVGVREVVDIAGPVNLTAVATADASAGAASQLTACEGATANTSVAYYLTAAGAPNAVVRNASCNSDGTGASTGELIRHCQLAGACYRRTSKVYLPLVFDSTYQGAVFVIDTATRTVVAKALSMSGATTTETLVRLGCMVEPDASTTLVPVLEKGRLAVQDDTTTTTLGVSELELTWDWADPLPPVVVEDLLFLPGACPMAYDGISATELGFNVYPEWLQTNDVGAGNVDAGTRQILAVYEWTDAKGRRHQSAPSLAIEWTNAGARSIDVRVQTLSLTEKYDNSGAALKPIARTNVDIVVFATEAAGTVLYRVGATANNPLAATGYVTVNYNIADATLIGNEVLYSTGGVLENFAPPACRVACVHDDRLIVAGTETNGVEYSKPLAPGQGIGFHPDQVLRLDPKAGEVVAVASFQERLVALAEKAIGVIAGEGPDALGQGAGYAPPQMLGAELGCEGPCSVVKAPDGLWFKADGVGIRRINADFSIDPVAGTEMDSVSAHTVSGAVHLPAKQQIRFTFSNIVASVYNYQFAAWAQFTNMQATWADVWNGLHVRCGVLGNGVSIHKDSDGVFADTLTTGVTTQYDVIMGTPPLHFAGVQGFQRVRKVLIEGHRWSTATLALSATWDYGEASTVELAAAPMPTKQIRHGLARQKCRAVAFSLTMTAANGRGFQFDNLALELGVKKGAFKRGTT